MTYCAPPEGDFSRKDFRWMAGISVVALLVRVVYLVSYSHTPYWDALVMDPKTHYDLALRLVEGRGLGPYAYFRAPLYIWVLAGFLALFGTSLWPIRIFQAVLGSLAAGLTFRLGRFFLPRAPSAIAGLVMAFFWIPVYFDGELLTENLAAALGTATLVLLLHADRRRRQTGETFPPFLLTGLLAGLTAITRPNILLFALLVPLITIIQTLQPHGKKEAPHPLTRLKKALSPALLFGAGLLIPLSPVTIRNLVVAHDFVLIASQGGINFWLGNNPEADGRTVVVPYLRRRIPAWFLKSRADHPWFQEDVWLSSAYGADLALRKKARESEIANYWFGETWKWIRQHPGPALRLLLKKTLFLISRTEVSNNRDLDHHARAIPFLHFLSFFHFGIISPFILAGIILALARPRRWLWPLVFYLAYAASVIAFFVTTRYRVPLLPLGAVFLALFIHQLADSLCLHHSTRAVTAGQKKKTWLHLLTLIFLLGLSSLLVNGNWVKWNDRPLRAAMHYNLGLTLAHKNPDLAIAELHEALRIKNQYPEAHFWLGKILVEQGQIQEGIKEWETTLKQDPQLVVAHYELHILYSGMSKSPDDDFARKARYHLYQARSLAPGILPETTSRSPHLP